MNRTYPFALALILTAVIAPTMGFGVGLAELAELVGLAGLVLLLAVLTYALSKRRTRTPRGRRAAAVSRPRVSRRSLPAMQG